MPPASACSVSWPRASASMTAIMDPAAATLTVAGAGQPAEAPCWPDCGMDSDPFATQCEQHCSGSVEAPGLGPAGSHMKGSNSQHGLAEPCTTEHPGQYAPPRLRPMPPAAGQMPPAYPLHTGHMGPGLLPWPHGAPASVALPPAASMIYTTNRHYNEAEISTGQLERPYGPPHLLGRLTREMPLATVHPPHYPSSLRVTHQMQPPQIDRGRASLPGPPAAALQQQLVSRPVNRPAHQPGVSYAFDAPQARSQPHQLYGNSACPPPPMTVGPRLEGYVPIMRLSGPPRLPAVAHQQPMHPAAMRLSGVGGCPPWPHASSSTMQRRYMSPHD